MTREEARAHGRQAGYSAATYCDWSIDEFDPSEHDDPAESLTSAAFESESNARSFSPWEHLANEINQDEDSEDLWEAYDQGVSKGIDQGVSQRVQTRKLLTHRTQVIVDGGEVDLEAILQKRLKVRR